MTDNEVIKALECCSTATCISNNCPYEKIHDIPTCATKLTRDALDLINRQKAEIERLRYNLEAMLDERADHSEAYKEFAERLKDKHRRIMDYDEAGFGAQIFIFEERVIDNLLKEMVGENNA